MEERPDVQKQILVDIAKKLPIFTRAQSGGKLSCQAIYLLFYCKDVICTVSLKLYQLVLKAATFWQLALCDSDHPHPELSAKASVSLVLIIKTKFEETGST